MSAPDKYYGRAATNYNNARLGRQWDEEEVAFRRLLNIAQDRLRETKSDINICDIPVGTGRWINAVVESNFRVRYLGVDISEDMLSEARKEIKGKEKSISADFMCADWQNFFDLNEQRQDTFDLVICTRFLGHWHRKDVEKIVSGLGRLTNRFVILQIRQFHGGWGAAFEALRILRRPRRLLHKLRINDTLSRAHMPKTFHKAIEHAGLRVEESVIVSVSSSSSYEYWLLGRRE
jgi:SAM-dependent methyltransferase